MAYSIVSLAMLVWLIGAARRAPFIEVWPAASWQRWASNLVMPLVCLLIAFAAGAPNPLSFGGARPEQFDPARPGIAGAARHPILLALALWAFTHLIPNGDLAHAILFGGFGAFALLGMGMIDRRNRRRLGAAEWRRLSARTSLLPFAKAGDAKSRAGLTPESAMRLAAAVALYLALLFMHQTVIGVSPIPVGL